MEREKYPILLIPEKFLLYYSGNPYPHTFCKSKPTEPIYEVYKEAAFNGCLGALMPFAIIFTIISIVAFFQEKKASGPDFLLFFVSVITFFLWIAANNNSENEKKEVERKNKNKKGEYLKEKEVYEKELREFKRLKLIEENSESDVEYRIKKLSEALNNTSKAETNYTGKKGRAEEFFTNFLKEYFNERIKTNLIIEAFYKSNPYQADIIFYYKKYNLWIDIEIDEPYNISENKPIHYIDEYNTSIDSSRNQYFSKHGWFVIRFSENQVLSNPLNCCKFISDTLNEYFAINEYSFYFESVAELEVENCWTFNEAIEMAAKRMRDL